MKGARYKTGGWYGESHRHYLAAKGISTGSKHDWRYSARRSARRPDPLTPVRTEEDIGRLLAESELTPEERRKLDELKLARVDLQRKVQELKPTLPKYRLAQQIEQASALLQNPDLSSFDRERLRNLLKQAEGMDPAIQQQILDKLENPALTRQEREQLREQIVAQNVAVQELLSDPEYKEFKQLDKRLKNLTAQIDEMQGFRERTLGPAKAAALSRQQVMDSRAFKNLLRDADLPNDPDALPTEVLEDAIVMAREKLQERKLPRGGKIGPFGDVPIPPDVRPKYLELLERQQRYALAQPGPKEMGTQAQPIEIRTTFTGERLPPSQFKRRTKTRDIVAEAEEKEQKEISTQLPSAPSGPPSSKPSDVASEIIRANERIKADKKTRKDKKTDEFSARKSWESRLNRLAYAEPPTNKGAGKVIDTGARIGTKIIQIASARPLAWGVKVGKGTPKQKHFSKKHFSKKDVEKKVKGLSPAERIFGYGITRTARSVEQIKESKLGGFRVK